MQSNIFNDYEYKILKYYKNGAIIREGDQEEIDTLCLVGMINTGISTKGNKPQETARLTELGLNYLHFEEIERGGPMKKFIYHVIGLIS